MGIVLASGSPRRRELLKMAGIDDFTIITSPHDERMPNLSPGLAVGAIALDKARSVVPLCKRDDVIIAADTLVYLDGKPLGKPENKDHAANMLRSLSGRYHTVYTGVAVIKDTSSVSSYEATRVVFRDLSESEILGYIETEEPYDKAGSYAAQGRGAVFIERIEGDFYNVVGLPICRLVLMLRDLGVAI